MAVRFLPPPEERPKPQREETGDLAEVIEFRSKLRRPEPQQEWAAPPATESEPTAAWAPAPIADASNPSDADGAAGVDLVEPEPAAPASWPRLIEAQFGRPVLRSTTAEVPVRDRPDADASDASRERDPELGRVHHGGDPADEMHADEMHDDEMLDDGPTAYETAVKLLARRAQSSGELQRALVAAGHPEFDAEEAVAKCEESLYLDDTDLACSVAAKLRDSKGESKARIRQKLRERHLPDSAIEAALDGLDDEAEFELLKQTAIDRARRMAGLDRQTAERRLLGFLARRGWSGERATRAAREALDGASPGGGGRGTVRFR